MSTGYGDKIHSGNVARNLIIDKKKIAAKSGSIARKNGTWRSTESLVLDVVRLVALL